MVAEPVAQRIPMTEVWYRWADALSRRCKEITGSITTITNNITNLTTIINNIVATPTPYRANISGAVSIDLSTITPIGTRTLHLTLTGNVSSFALTNPVDGAVYNIRMIQDATGGRTFSGMPSTFRSHTGLRPTYSTGANEVDFHSAQYGATEGTYMWAFHTAVA
jgi:hypothetical protein